MRTKLIIKKLAVVLLLLLGTPICHAVIVGPYTADANTPYLFHLDGAAGTSTAINSGSVGGNSFSVQNSTTGNGTAAPPLVTTVMGATAFSGFGNAATFPTAGMLIGFDANNSGAFQSDVSSSTLSPDRITMNTLNIGSGGQSPFTLEAMIFPTVTNANQEIISTDSSASARGFLFRLTAGGGIEFNSIAQGGSITNLLPTTGFHAYTPNTWFHVAVTYDGTNVRLYWTKVDPTVTAANLIKTAAATIGTTEGGAQGPLCIGNENRNSSGELFQGLIDEVRISKIARAANDMLFKNGVTITANPGNTIVAPGGTAIFHVVASTDFAPLSYQWRSNGVSLVDGGDFSGSLTPTLQIANVQSAYASGVVYDCIVTNSRSAPGPDTATSSTATITIHTPLNLSWLATPADHLWNTASIDWLDTAQSTNAPFTAGDNVTFDNTGDNSVPVTVSGAVQPGSLVFNNASYTLIGGGKITGAAGLTKTGSGVLTMLAINDYTGVTSIGGGAVSVAVVTNGGIASPIGAASSSSSNFLLDGGSFQYTGPTASSDRGATLGIGGGTLDVTNASTVLNLSGTIAGTSGGGLTKIGNGTLLLSGANTYYGPTTISAGMLQLSGVGTFGGGNVTNNNILLSSGTRTITNTIAGTGVLTNDATGTLTLSGSNSYSGPTAISGPNNGGLIVANSSALGNSPQVTLFSTTGGALGGARVTLNAGVNVPSGTALAMPSVGTTVRSTLFAAGASSWNGPITLNGDGAAGNQLAFAGSGGFLTIGGNINSPAYAGTLQLRGDGSGAGGAGGLLSGVATLAATSTVQVNDGVTWTVSSSGNTWGTSQIAKGTLQLGTNNALPSSTTVQLGAAGNGVLDLAGFNQQIGGLSTAGTASNQVIGNSSTSSDATLIYNGAGASTYGGNLVDVLGGGTHKVALTVAGGTLTLAGSSTYSGNTAISGGTLALTGGDGIVNSPNINISAGATLNASGRTDGSLSLSSGQTLTGSGTVVGLLSVGSGSTVSPGSGVGVLTDTGSILLQGGGTEVVEVMDATAGAGAGWDLLSASGDLDIFASASNTFTIKLASLDGTGSPGNVTNFDNNTSYVWTFASGNVSNFDAAAFNLDISSFSNDLAGGQFGIQAGVSNLNLSFTNNRPPVANNLTLLRPLGAPLKLTFANLATNWSDPDGDPVALVSIGASTNGATITTNATTIIYANTNDVDDAFTYTIRDLRNYRPQDTVRTATGTINIVSTNIPVNVQAVTLGPGGATISLAGVPGYTYELQRSTNMALVGNVIQANWVTLFTTNAPQSSFQWVDNFSDLGGVAPDAAYYRMLQP